MVGKLFIGTILLLMILPEQSLLDEFRWKKRILLFYGPEEEVKAQKSLFLMLEDEVMDRDLIFIEASSDQVMINNHLVESHHFKQLQIKFNLNKSFTSLLIGKDGGVKLRSSQLVDPKEVFQLIDSMPMRKSEMRKGN